MLRSQFVLARSYNITFHIMLQIPVSMFAHPTLKSCVHLCEQGSGDSLGMDESNPFVDLSERFTLTRALAWWVWRFIRTLRVMGGSSLRSIAIRSRLLRVPGDVPVIRTWIVIPPSWILLRTELSRAGFIVLLGSFLPMELDQILQWYSLASPPNLLLISPTSFLISTVVFSAIRNLIVLF